MSQTIVPSQMAKMLYEAKKKAAQKGHDLLKRKADALKAQFMQVTKALIEQKKDLGNKFNQSLIFLAKANFAAVGGDVNRIVDENVKTRADVKLTLKTKPVAGVTLPQFGLRNMAEEKFGDNTIIKSAKEVKTGLDISGGITITYQAEVENGQEITVEDLENCMKNDK